MLPAEAAGVLPVAFDETSGRVWVLLGREAKRQGFRSAFTWCDFGGSVCNPKKSNVGVAAQELTEETIGSLTDAGPEELERWVRTHMITSAMSNIGHKTPYALYAVEFPFLPEVPLIFEHRYRLARRTRTTTTTTTTTTTSDESPLSQGQPQGSPQEGSPQGQPQGSPQDQGGAPPGFKEFDLAFERETRRLRALQPAGFQNDGRVRKHWMEKDLVSWFPLEHLSATHATPGHQHPLRPEFGITLRQFEICEKIYSHFLKRKKR